MANPLWTDQDEYQRQRAIILERKAQAYDEIKSLSQVVPLHPEIDRIIKGVEEG